MDKFRIDDLFLYLYTCTQETGIVDKTITLRRCRQMVKEHTGGNAKPHLIARAANFILDRRMPRIQMLSEENTYAHTAAYALQYDDNPPYQIEYLSTEYRRLV